MTEQSTTGGTAGGSQDRLQQAASDVVDKTTETVGNRIDEQGSSQLQRAGDMLGSVAQAVRDSGDQLRDQQPQVASVADTAASQIERFAGHVRESRPSDLLHDVEQFAREQPAIFLGGALLVGAVAARLLKASPQAGNGMQAGYGSSTSRYGTGYRTGYGGDYGSDYGTRYDPGYGGSAYGGSGSGASGYGSAAGSYGDPGTTMGTVGDGGTQG